MSKFTEGPWLIEFDDMGGYDAFYAGYHILAPNWERDICTVEVRPWRFHRDDERKLTWDELHAENESAAADAALIAASPDMYEALDNLENDDGAIPEHAWNMVQAALSKARGEQ